MRRLAHAVVPAICAACLGVLTCAPAAAQEASPARFAIETVASADRFADSTRAAGAAVDAFLSLRLTGEVQIVAQPIVKRLPNGLWIRRLYQLAVRYEPRGPLPIRLEAGQIMAPVGLGTLQYRSDLTATVSLPSMYFLRLPAAEPGAPPADFIAPGYPIGVQATVSDQWWDARVALVDGSPLRMRRHPFGEGPPRLAQIAAGAGVHLRPGLRLGVSAATGRYARAGEIPGARGDHRTAAVVGIEGEYAIGHTRVTAEWLRDSLETATGRAVARGGLAEIRQTLAPRWFAAARVERVTAFDGAAARPRRVTFAATDASIGYRIDPEVTLRAGHVARRDFGRDDYDHQFGVSIVWSRRWW